MTPETDPLREARALRVTILDMNEDELRDVIRRQRKTIRRLKQRVKETEDSFQLYKES